MLLNGPRESDKTELAIQINSFDKPTELNDVNAWSQLMLNLIFLKPGTYPSMPEMGVGIEDYQYDFLEEAVEELAAKINEQQSTYLPDIPLAGTQISKIDNNGHPVLLIKLFFNAPSGKTVASAIAINAESRKFIDFEISW